MRAAYRLRQFWQALTATSNEDDLRLAREILTPNLLSLFHRMQSSEISHSLSITRQLWDRGEKHPDLLAAALLHDVGKSRYPIKIWERAEIVLGGRFCARTARKWGRSAELKGWKRIFVVAEQHPEWGAEMAAAAGASDLSAALIRRHQEPPRPVTREQVAAGSAPLEDYLLYQLQRLDEES